MYISYMKIFIWSPIIIKIFLNLCLQFPWCKTQNFIWEILLLYDNKLVLNFINKKKTRKQKCIGLINIFLFKLKFIQ